MAPLSSKPCIRGLEPFGCRLRLIESPPLLLLLGLNLNLPSTCEILKLREGTVMLGQHKLPNINFEHDQVSFHSCLLLSSELRKKKSRLSKHLGDLFHRLCQLPQIQVLLSQSLPFHQGKIPDAKHLIELIPSKNTPLLRSIRTSHHVPPFLHTQLMEVYSTFEIPVLWIETDEETPLYI